MRREKTKKGFTLYFSLHGLWSRRGRQQLKNYFRFNPGKIRVYRRLEHLFLKVIRGKLQLSFLRNCIEDKIVPKSFIPSRLRNKFYPYSSTDHNIMQDFLNNRKHILNDDYYNLRQYHCFIRNKFSNDVDCEISNLIKTVK